MNALCRTGRTDREGPVSDLALQWEDRNAIEQLIYCYSDAVTRADYVQMETVFADDAVWESAILGMHFETAREFIDFQADGSNALDVLIQTASNPPAAIVSISPRMTGSLQSDAAACLTAPCNAMSWTGAQQS